MKCPYCFEAIKPKAIKCKHCGENLSRRINFLNILISPAQSIIKTIFKTIIVLFVLFFIVNTFIQSL